MNPAGRSRATGRRDPSTALVLRVARLHAFRRALGVSLWNKLFEPSGRWNARSAAAFWTRRNLIKTARRVRSIRRPATAQ